MVFGPNYESAAVSTGRSESTGVEPRTEAQSSARQLLRLAQRVIPNEDVIALVTVPFGRTRATAASVEPRPTDNLGFSLGQLLDAWTAAMDATTVHRVPVYLSSYFRSSSVTVVPLTSTGWSGGAILVDTGQLSPPQRARLEDLAARWANAASAIRPNLAGPMSVSAPDAYGTIRWVA